MNKPQSFRAPRQRNTRGGAWAGGTEDDVSNKALDAIEKWVLYLRRNQLNDHAKHLNPKLGEIFLQS